MQRFTPKHPCPICRGYASAKRRQGRRCYGFLSTDGDFAHCTREEHAGGLARHPHSHTFAHRLRGECQCGREHSPRKEAPPQTWDYWDAGGQRLLYQVCRYETPEGKTYRVRRPDGGNNWLWGLGEIAPVLYNLPALLLGHPDDPVWVVEGEKACDSLARLGSLAVTNPFGAGSWREEYSARFAGREVVILPDADEPGRSHAEKVAASLYGKAKSLKVVDLYPDRSDGADIADWIETGKRCGTAEGKAPDTTRLELIEELENQAAQAQQWQPNTFSYHPTLVRGKVLPADPRAGPTCPREFVFADLWQEAQANEEQLDFLPFLESSAEIFPVGLSTILAAYPKTGKTTLMFRLARQWAAQGRQVLYLTEESERLWRARLAVSGEEAGLAGITGVSAIGVSPEALLARAAGGEENIVILDTTNLLGVEDGNDASTVRQALTPWVAVQQEQGKTLLLTHHTNKEQRGDLRAVAGSYNFAAIVDTVLVLRPNESPSRRVLGGNSRIFPVEPVMYELQGPSLVVLGEPKAVELEQVKEKVLAYLAENPGAALKTGELLDRMPSPKPCYTQLRVALAALAQAGRIERDPPLAAGEKPGGTYRWQLPGRQTLPNTTGGW